MSEDDHPAQPESLKEQLLRGSAWTIGMRWSIKALGFVSTIILARLLLPEDFGLVAMAMAISVILQTVSDVGLRGAIVQIDRPDESHYATAWTIQIIQQSIVAGLLVVSAFVFPGFLGEPRLFDILLLMAFAQFLSGFHNTWIISFQKDMQFGRDFRYFVGLRAFRFFATVAFALWLRTYWAIVFGMLAGTIFALTMSYVIGPKRPYITLDKFRELWSFSQWYLLRMLAEILFRQSDRLFLGRFSGASRVGVFSVSNDLPQMVANEIAAPAARALMPGFVAVRNDRGRLQNAFLKTLGATVTLIFPLSIGLALVADYFVPVVLGPNWLLVIPLVQILAFGAGFDAVAYHCNALMLTQKLTKYSSFVGWGQTILYLALLGPVYNTAGLPGLALFKVFVSVVAAIASVAIISAKLSFSTLNILRSQMRAIGATIVMAGGLLFVRPLVVAWPPLPTFLGLVFLGGVLYVATLLWLWRLSDEQDSIEAEAINRLQRRFGKTG